MPTTLALSYSSLPSSGVLFRFQLTAFCHAGAFREGVTMGNSSSDVSITGNVFQGMSEQAVEVNSSGAINGCSGTFPVQYINATSTWLFAYMCLTLNHFVYMFTY